MAEKWAYPSSSIAAKSVIQTIRVGVGSSQIEESRILVKSLLYTAITVTGSTLRGNRILSRNTVRFASKLCYMLAVPDDQVHIRYDGGARTLQDLFCRIMGCRRKTHFWLFSTGPDERMPHMKLTAPIKPNFRRPFSIVPDEPVDINDSGTYIQVEVLSGDSTVTIDPTSTGKEIKGWLNGDGSTGEKSVRFTADGHLGEGDQPVSLDVDYTVATPDATILGFTAGTDEPIPA